MATGPTQASEESTGETLAEALAVTEAAKDLLADGRTHEAADAARRATRLAPKAHQPWVILARALSQIGRLDEAYGAFEWAASLAGDARELSGEMGSLALRLGRDDAAERLLTAEAADSPSPARLASLAEAQTRLGKFDAAHATLKTAIEGAPGEAQLWLALGRLLCAQGRHPDSVVFLQEALRLDPGSAEARDGLAEALLIGADDVEQALALSAEALASAEPSRSGALAVAHGRRLLAAGRIKEGWSMLAQADDTLAARIRIAAPRWNGGRLVQGRLLLAGEPDVVDEMLFARVVPELLAEGHSLILAVSERWTGLAQRSFPDALVVPLLARMRDGRLEFGAQLDTPHVHGGELVGAWAPLRTVAASRRRRLEGVPVAAPYLRIDEGRRRHWQEMLGLLAPGPKIGITWRSPGRADAQAWRSPPLAALEDPLSAPGLQLIALQAESFFGEFNWIRETHGLQIQTPPGLDPGDLDHLSALMCALDVVVGPLEPATCAAAACGAETWLLGAPGEWARLGTDGYPWFPRARTILRPSPSDWGPAMAELEEALTGLPRRT